MSTRTAKFSRMTKSPSASKVDLGFTNPYRPGAGHMPPHLAGRHREYGEFEKLLEQDSILKNLILTGLRGVGKSVLLDTFKPRALAKGWLWVGTDLSESASVSEENLATRILTDMSVVTSTLTITVPKSAGIGFGAETQTEELPLTYPTLKAIYNNAAGLVADKLKEVLLFIAEELKKKGNSRVIFAYDEAQNLADNAERNEYPLSVLLDVFQYIQRKNIPFMLVLTGLPTLFPKLVEARTYTERMFRVVTLPKLDEDESTEAVVKPLDVAGCPIRFDQATVKLVYQQSDGYPYFIQFICREIFDVWIRQLQTGEEASVPMEAIQLRLDTEFFAGRWDKATDRQRELLWVISHLDRPDGQFSIQDLVTLGKTMLTKPFSSSHVNQMLASLIERGLIYKNRFGKYSFAVPLLDTFILRTYDPSVS
jgi:hypothetical protein